MNDDKTQNEQSISDAKRECAALLTESMAGDGSATVWAYCPRGKAQCVRGRFKPGGRDYRAATDGYQAVSVYAKKGTWVIVDVPKTPEEWFACLADSTLTCVSRQSSSLSIQPPTRVQKED